MAELNNLPESDDTKTRVTEKITPGTPGKSAPAIDLDTKAAAPDSSTMTRRTLKLQGLAGLAVPKPQTTAAAAPKPQATEEEDTRTRRTVKLSTLANGPSIKPLNLNRPAPSPAAAPAATVQPKEDTVTRRTQKLEALDTQDVIAMTEQDLSSDTNTRKTVKLAAPTAAPPPQAANSPTPKTRQTVKVEGIVPAHTPVIDLDAKPGDTNTRKTVKLSVPEAAAPEIDLDAPAGDDTRTRKSVKVEANNEKFSSGNVDDTVKLQRPAPKPVMPGSVAPAAQAGSSAVGGIKLSKPTPAKAPTAAPAKAPTAAPAAAPAAAPVAAPAEAPAKGGLKVNTDAVKNLGKAPVTQNAPAAGENADSGVISPVEKTVKDSMIMNVIFSFFGVLAIVFLLVVAAVAITDHINIWVKDSSEPKIELPLLPDMVEELKNSQNAPQNPPMPNGAGDVQPDAPAPEADANADADSEEESEE